MSVEFSALKKTCIQPSPKLKELCVKGQKMKRSTVKCCLLNMSGALTDIDRSFFLNESQQNETPEYNLIMKILQS